MTIRSVAFLVNPSRPEALSAARELAPLLFSAGFSLYTVSDIDIEGIRKVAAEDLPEIELAVVLGGDGTILRAAEVTLARKIPLLGINLGHVGFFSRSRSSDN